MRFWNDERVSDYEDYTFNISYTMPRGVILYGESVYFSQIIPFSSCEDGSATIVKHPDDWRLNSSSAQDYEENLDTVTFGSLPDTLTLWFDTDRELTAVEEYTSGIFNITVPTLYADHVLSQVDELNSLLPVLEQKTGITTPNRFHIQYLPLRSKNISEEAAGQYYGGKIEIKSTQLAKKDITGVETLLHEVVHGYNNKLSFGSPDWWWEEGTANYIAHQVLQDAGHNASIFLPSRKRIDTTFENCEFTRGFISDWSPVDNEDVLEVELVYPCGIPQIRIVNDTESGDETDSPVDYITDEDRLGYQYSELIVSDIFKNTSADVSTVHTLMQRENISFSNSTDLMNKQINYFASQATGKDLTSFLQSRGIETEAWSDHEERLTGAEQRIRMLEASYRFQLFQEYLGTLDQIERRFHQGHFSDTRQARGVVQEAERRNRSAHATLTEYRDVRDYIRDLEAQHDPPFYEEEVRKLNQTLDLVRQLRFEEAQERFQATRQNASQKEQRIQSYQQTYETVKTEAESTSILVSPFLFDANSQVEAAQQSFREGDLAAAQKTLVQADWKVTWSKPIAAVFYLLILIFISGGWYRAKKGRWPLLQDISDSEQQGIKGNP